MDLFGFYNYGAELSSDRKYRFALWRIWDKSKPLLMYIGLNPSTANEHADDNTITRLKSITNRLGYGGFYMMNCFPFISSDPSRVIINRIAENDQWLLKTAKNCDRVVFAWGAFDLVKQEERDKDLINLFPDAYALDINQDGSPKHPLYVPTEIQLIPYHIDTDAE